ncbi:MAG: hypothetical protein N4A33_04155 [Bacteriovoracaceae bacterium]|jgi:hypothetical protein|nr:hypothetical protein [Bacteriovoracaceae bacterium]
MEAQVHNIFNLQDSKIFSEDEAYELVNLFLAVTSKAKNKISSYSSQMEYHKNIPDQAAGFEKRLNLELHKWSEKIKRLGGIPLSLYKVKIPANEGFFLWQFPAATIEHHY